MSPGFAVWALLLCLSCVWDGLCLRWLALSGMGTGQILVLRGWGCLLLVLILAGAKISLRPSIQSLHLVRRTVDRLH